MNGVIGTTGCSDKLRVAWGPIHNSITTLATAGGFFPFTQARLNIPFYDIANPTAIVSKPMKTITYLDCYSLMVEDAAGIGMITSNKTFSVQVGNQNVFQDVQSYDWMTFLDEFSKIGAVNNDLSREISNGLIGIDKWQTTQRILVADCSRVSDVNVSQSIKISGTNIATQGTNFLVLTIEEVYSTDPGYCRWLLNKKTIIGDDSDIAKFLKEKFDNDDGSFLLTWGKHKNRSIKQIQAADPTYLEWLSKNDFVKTKYPKLKAEVDALLA
ncbi:unnamed protein product [Phytophthora lilii]|uniref:Unnamed protein product n=1 Tax=Phytophthora lilii TaxID=2077276 RepID=A0A9W6TXX1_9STRA|nr:unnamed protein product [Phytophthora lilii]